MPNAVDPEVVTQTVAAEARALRARKGWAQVEAAEVLGWTRPRLASLEAGRRTVSVVAIFELAVAYGVPVTLFTSAIAEALED